ncbi:hypothetical protein JMJ35_009701 [Cladonia borealis]|uniref:Cytochrome P450 n=1 Tax=Cladonia borealis TaxID=184061 RepID=A0AA39QRF2_9LECA|nr:hypothetical protein JMJ35_009701 [Cladonia borealis]
MTSQPRLPILPYGSPTTLSGLSETFTFHASPEAFITSRVLAFQASNASLADSRTPVRAKVLNRNIAVVSSYDHIKHLLCDEANTSKLSAGKAYDDLMAPFFPPPNLLLADGPSHQPKKDTWVSRIASLPAETQSLVQETLFSHFRDIPSESTVDLYESMKALSWKLILSIFMSSSDERNQAQKDAAEIESLQEDLLRGQFSLFPISINTPLWRSPRAKGLVARKKLQSLLKGRVQNGNKGCPFATSDSAEEEDIANHLLLFTSSLAVKSLASLLTAVMLNLYVYHDETSSQQAPSVASRILSLEIARDRDELLNSTILETERLSPPVVGIMRRTTQDVTLSAQEERFQDTLIPQGWDVWLYFVGAARDPAIFGKTADSFLSGRYYKTADVAEDPRSGFAFGTGQKSCLGETLMREVVTTVAKTCLGMNGGSRARVVLEASMNDVPTGVQGWLGWEKDVKPEDWAKDMKQLPTQRPIKGVTVEVVHDLNLE